MISVSSNSCRTNIKKTNHRIIYVCTGTDEASYWQGEKIAYTNILLWAQQPWSIKHDDAPLQNWLYISTFNSILRFNIQLSMCVYLIHSQSCVCVCMFQKLFWQSSHSNKYKHLQLKKKVCQIIFREEVNISHSEKFMSSFMFVLCKMVERKKTNPRQNINEIPTA